MEIIKCATFKREGIPPHIIAKMKSDREKAQLEAERKKEKYNFSHVWVDGFGWENTVFLASDFDVVNLLNEKAEDGSLKFEAYSVNCGVRANERGFKGSEF